MTAVQTDRSTQPLGLYRSLAIYALLCNIAAAAISPLARPDAAGWIEYSVYRFGIAAWTAQVLILVAVLILSVPSLVVAFQLALLTALVQGYAFVAFDALWYGTMNSDVWDNQIRFAVILGLSATVSAVLWLLWRIVWKVGLSAEAAEGQGRSGQLGLREMLYVMASLSAVLAFISLFSFPRVIPTEQMLALTIQHVAIVGPAAYAPFWLSVRRRFVNWNWLWVVPLILLFVALAAWNESDASWRPWHYRIAAFIGTVLGNSCIVAANAAALQMLGLTWRRGAVQIEVPQGGG